MAERLLWVFRTQSIQICKTPVRTAITDVTAAMVGTFAITQMRLTRIARHLPQPDLCRDLTG